MQQQPGSAPKLSKATIAVVVVLALGVGITLALRSNDSPTVDSESGLPNDAASGSSTSRSAARNVLTSNSVQWREFFGVRLPIADAGPTTIAAGRASGFERSEAGAVLAAIHISQRSEYPPGPRVFEPSIQEQVVGVDKGDLLLVAQNGYQEALTRGAPGPSGEVSSAFETARRNQTAFWGYRVDAFSQETASVAVLVRTLNSGRPVYANFDLTVRWVDGDWRLVAPLNGQFRNVLKIVEDVPSGYTILGAAAVATESADG